MASEQQQRRVRDENVSEERDVHVEKDLVPNLASHFESLAEKVRDSEVVAAKEIPTGEDKSKVSITLAGKHGVEEGGGNQQTRAQIGLRSRELKTDEERNRGSEKMATESKNRGSEIMEGGARNVRKFEERESQTPTLEEVSKARQQAQQNSIDTLRRAEATTAEKGAQAKDTVAEHGRGAVEIGQQGLGYAREKLTAAGQTAAEYTKGTAQQARDTVTQSAQVVPEYGRVVVEKGQQGLGYAKDKLAAAGQTAAEYSKQTAEQAKNLAGRTTGGTVDTAKQVKDYTAEKAVAAKDYTAEKAVQAKDVTLETGKGAASMAGKVAGEVVDRVAVVGWGAAHLTAEVAVEGTKMAAKAVTGVAGYAKDTAVAVGSKATEITAKQVENVKEVAASAGEKAKDFTARKKEEAQKDLQSKKTETTQVGYEGQTEGGGTGEKVEGAWESTKGAVGSVIGGDERKASDREVQAGQGVFGAIGETIMEIAQQTTELVAPVAEEEDDSFLTEESGGRKAS